MLVGVFFPLVCSVTRPRGPRRDQFLSVPWAMSCLCVVVEEEEDEEETELRLE